MHLQFQDHKEHLTILIVIRYRPFIHSQLGRQRWTDQPEVGHNRPEVLIMKAFLWNSEFTCVKICIRSR